MTRSSTWLVALCAAAFFLVGAALSLAALACAPPPGGDGGPGADGGGPAVDSGPPDTGFPPPDGELVPQVGSDDAIDVATWNIENFPQSSDTPALVADLITQAVTEHESIKELPKPSVVFEDFGDNALIFDAYFWCDVGGEKVLREVRSDLRFRISELFAEHDIVVSVSIDISC